MYDPIQRLTRLLEPLIAEGYESINADVIETGQSVNITIYCGSDPESVTVVQLPDEMVTDVVSGCQDLRRHFFLMGSSVSRAGLQVFADGRNAVWAESHTAERSAESQEPAGPSAAPTEGI